MSTDLGKAPASSGYEILQIYALEQHYEVVSEGQPADEAAEDETTEELPIRANWDWRVLHERDFEVQFGIEMPPTAEVHESIRVRFVLRARAGKDLTLQPFKFVMAPAISLLIPYIRETITSMSVRGPIGVRYLNPLNANALAGHFSFEKSIGARQLADDPDLAELYGWTPPVTPDAG